MGRPAAEEKVPGAQLAHIIDPTVEEDPAAQLEHTSTEEAPTTALYVPATQPMHEVEDVAETTEDQVPAKQALQIKEPGNDHVPTVQDRHRETDDEPATDDHEPELQLVQ